MSKQEPGDFTATPRTLLVALLALGIGGIATCVAWALLQFIQLFTNLFYYGRFDTAPVSPANHHLGWYAVFVPVAGGLIIGVMARFGSERIRGHGIPEALESILMHGSKVQPRLALLKPISAAISIGSGGPFGAEGPIIVTGGACGSILAQFFHLSATERKTLLVAGAAAGMSATFAAPVSATLLAVELLLFEWKPRSLIPVALAAGAAGAGRRYLLGLGPVFPTPAHPILLGPAGLAGCALAGLLAGLLSCILTKGVYAAEDLFHKLPIHWMWWPALGGLVVGLGGLVFPPALGVGYETIGTLLQGNTAGTLIAGVLLVKSVIWILSLGSGTSGGVLAPLLMMGAALGGLEAKVLPALFPNLGAGFWPLIGMGAILAGTMGTPLTGILFAFELTHDGNVMLPLLVAGALAYATTVLTLKRSILTEKVARRGYHMSREYAIDPLEILSAREVMRTRVTVLASSAKVGELVDHAPPRGQHLYPVTDPSGRLAGVITRRQMRKMLEGRELAVSLGDVAKDAVVAFEKEPLRVVVSRMAQSGLTVLPVVEAGTRRFAGMISLRDLLQARARNLREEHHRERVLPGARLPAA